VRHADNIVVLAGGRIIEQGSHEELMSADGRYAGLFRLQAERFAADGEWLEVEGDLDVLTREAPAPGSLPEAQR